MWATQSSQCRPTRMPRHTPPDLHASPIHERAPVDVSGAMLYSLARRLGHAGLRRLPATTAPHLPDDWPPVLLPAKQCRDGVAKTTPSVAFDKGNAP